MRRITVAASLIWAFLSAALQTNKEAPGLLLLTCELASTRLSRPETFKSMAAAAAQIGWVLVLIMSGSILECSPAWAAIAASPKHGAAALTVAAPQQRGWAACKTGCNALERARAAVQLETSSTSAAAGRGEGLPAVTNRGVEAIPCICGASAGTNDNQLAETAFCRRERKKCAKECGGKDHMYFM